ncbi:MAG: hypothetical protein A3C47_00015 [Omnitrophica bacterium RIFCSPHIGHO2_02_FULL_51_18]|nr:MAG: hypothetical protein A3C47_00015 [Omnitrophica bacterium RIFCSPHIGHO2_02_FULL_51_18]
MITEIGIVSGEIWHYLEQHKTCSLTELVEGTDKSRNVVLMALGWLSREGHVILEDRENDYKITLRF